MACRAGRVSVYFPAVRLFLAINLPADARRHLLDVRGQLEAVLPRAAYTKPENLHLTLKFLGEVEPKRVGAVVESLSMIRPQAIELHASGIECFPGRGPIRVVTAAMEGSVRTLRAMVEAIEQRCRVLGFEREQRGYKPHVTLGRARPVLSATFRQIAADATAGLWPGPSFPVEEFTLMESRLGPNGAVYSKLGSFPIGQK